MGGAAGGSAHDPDVRRRDKHEVLRDLEQVGERVVAVLPLVRNKGVVSVRGVARDQHSHRAHPLPWQKEELGAVAREEAQ